MAKKMPRRLVALSSSAIAAVYLAGYLTTQSADARLAQDNGTGKAVPASLNLGTTTGMSTSGSPALSGSAPASAAGPASAMAGYQDGMFHGTGTSRRGNVSVAVTVQGGRIAGVSITGATTQYPTSRIAALPGQVIARQSAQVDRVSGATYSAMAFQQAVQQALAQARVIAAPAAAGTGQGISPVQPVQPVQPAQPAQSARAAQPAVPAQPGQPVQPRQRAEPVFPDRGRIEGERSEGGRSFR